MKLWQNKHNIIDVDVKSGETSLKKCLIPIRIEQIHFLPAIHDPCIIRNNNNNKCTQIKKEWN